MVETQHPSMAGIESVFERAAGEVEIREVHPREAAVVSLSMPPEATPPSRV